MNRRHFILASTAGLATIGGIGAARSESLTISDLYAGDASFSALAQATAGQVVTISGFMAPPLKAESSFFVLTKMPMAVCPFCESEADWPTDIVAVYGRDIITVAPFNVPIVVSGVLDLGVLRDEELGFVSKVRLMNAIFQRA
jgi:hypothetical protein